MSNSNRRINMKSITLNGVYLTKESIKVFMKSQQSAESLFLMTSGRNRDTFDPCGLLEIKTLVEILRFLGESSKLDQIKLLRQFIRMGKPKRPEPQMRVGP